MEQLMKTNGNGDVLSIIFNKIDTVELIRWYYNPQIKTRAYLDGVFAELNRRINSLDVDNLEANKDALFEIYAQSQNKHKIPNYLANKISDIVRRKVQQQVDDVCGGHGFIQANECDLSSTGQNSGIISNNLLEALVHFEQNIFVPSNVRCLYLWDLELTSLWLRFRKDSKINRLFLDHNNFKELNYRTFGQYIDGVAGYRLRVLGIQANVGISQINFDEVMIPNIFEVSAVGCVSLSEITNIPRSVTRMYVQHTNIQKAAQFQFKYQTDNNLENVTF